MSPVKGCQKKLPKGMRRGMRFQKFMPFFNKICTANRWTTLFFPEWVACASHIFGFLAHENGGQCRHFLSSVFQEISVNFDSISFTPGVV
ncbi:hypothetical protein [Allofranklinella schreckenbergeri]|uniref:hypothetical protein n=1 Tax=Allofranklinella schreckenbergeri TaxID=1076744 RepID=UPI0011C3D2F1|nr:hypothetical protein [Allofranklinella schreckenbergeri]